MFYLVFPIQKPGICDFASIGFADIAIADLLVQVEGVVAPPDVAAVLPVPQHRLQPHQADLPAVNRQANLQ